MVSRDIDLYFNDRVTFPTRHISAKCVLATDCDRSLTALPSKSMFRSCRIVRSKLKFRVHSLSYFCWWIWISILESAFGRCRLLSLVFSSCPSLILHLSLYGFRPDILNIFSCCPSTCILSLISLSYQPCVCFSTLIRTPSLSLFFCDSSDWVL